MDAIDFECEAQADMEARRRRKRKRKLLLLAAWLLLEEEEGRNGSTRSTGTIDKTSWKGRR